jgi:hypothetical protein
VSWRHAIALSVSSALLLAAGGCGGDEAEETKPGALATMAPPDSLYFEVTLQPEGDQGDAVSAFGERISGRPEDPDAFGQGLVSSILRDTEESSSLDYQRDVEPWIGDRLGGFTGYGAVGARSEALIVATRDPDEAQDAIEKALPRGVEHRAAGDAYFVSGRRAYAFADDRLIVGSESGVRDALEAAAGSSLGESESFSQGLEKQPLSDSFGLIAGDLAKAWAPPTRRNDPLSPRITAAVNRELGLAPDELSFLAVSVSGSALRFDLVLPTSKTIPSQQLAKSLNETPDGAFGAYVDGTFGVLLREAFRVGFQQGLAGSAREAGLTVSEMRDLVRTTGSDPLTTLEQLGNVATLFLLGPARNPVVGLTVPTAGSPDASIQLAKVVLRDGLAGRALPGLPLPHDPPTTLATLPGASLIVAAAGLPQRVGVAAGTIPERVFKALALADPRTPPGLPYGPDHPSPEKFEPELDPGYELSGFADLSIFAPMTTVFARGVDGRLLARFFLRTDVVAGVRGEDGRSITRVKFFATD